MNQRVAYLFIKEDSHWESNRHIERELRSTYLKLFPDSIKFFSFSLKNSKDWENIIAAIVAYSPQTIILADSRIKFPYWIEKISQELEYKARWVLHTYGCILSRQDELIIASKFLTDQELLVIAPSTAHQRILANFFLPQTSVVKVPFPCQIESQVPLKNCISWREKLNISSDTKIFLSAGRISMNKNVHHLISLFESYYQTNQKSALIVCGSIDYQTTLNFNYLAEDFNLRLMKAQKNKIPIFYLGHLPRESLLTLMNQSNSLINLSTNIGEDFGLAVAEALNLGLPAILSNWGGHRDFGSNPLVKLVDLNITGQYISIDQEQLFSFMDQPFPKNPQNTSSSSETLKALKYNLNKPFSKHQGMSPRFISYAKKLTFRSALSEESFLKEFENELYPYWR